MTGNCTGKENQMKDQEKTREQLIKELEELRPQVARLRQENAECRSDNQRLESALRESELRHKALLYNLPEKLFSKDRDSVYLSCNHNYARDFGITPEQIVGKTDHDFYPSELAEKYRADDRRIMDSGATEEIEETYSTPAGKEFVVRTVKAALKDEHGNVNGILGIFSDITARKKAEAALREAHDELERKVEERTAELTEANEELAVFKRFVEAAGEGFAMADLNHRVTYANPAMLGLMGLHNSDQALNQNLMSLHPQSVQGIIGEAVIPTLLHGGHWTGEIPIRSRAGQKRQAVAHAFLVRNEDGQPSHYGVVATDITERKQAENALQQNHDELQAIYDGMIDGLVIADHETEQILRANPSICKMLGYSEAELLSMSVRDINPFQPLPTTPEIARAEAEGRVHVHENVPVRRKDGSMFYADIVNNYLDYSGRRCVIGFFRDIIERKRAEEALRQSHDELRAIYDATVDGLLVTDIETRQFIRANASICRMLGYSETELRRLSVSDIHPAEALPFILERIGSVAEIDVTPPGDIPFLRKDGSVFYGEIIGKLLTHDGRPCAMALVRDITERRRAEEALRQSRDELEAIYNGMVEGLVILDSETMRIVRVNASLCRLLGYAEQELLSLSIMDIHPADDFAATVQRIQTRVVGKVQEDTNVPMLRKDGSIFYADIMGNRLTYGGRPCVLGLFRDITERKQAQAALERERQTLRHLLQSSDHERQLIAYEIHDGLAQYLYGSIMQFEVYDNLKETKPKDAKKAFDAGITLLHQSHGDARRLISGVRPPILDEEGIVAAISHLANEYRRQEGTDVETQTAVKFGRLAPIMENAIYRIAQEALTNACKHSKSDHIRLELVQHGEIVRLMVQDWGIGFNPKEVEENRFGLAGMRERARLLGGTICIESTPGEGTCIAVELPLATRE